MVISGCDIVVKSAVALLLHPVKGFKTTFLKVFASLFVKRVWVSGRSPEKLKKRERLLHILYNLTLLTERESHENAY